MKVTEEVLTAYALGELEGDERKEVERHLAQHAEARTHVEEIRETAGLITKELSREPANGLTGEQRAKIATISRSRPSRFLRRLTVFAAAAVVLIVVTCVAIVVASNLIPYGSKRPASEDLAKAPAENASQWRSEIKVMPAQTPEGAAGRPSRLPASTTIAAGNYDKSLVENSRSSGTILVFDTSGNPVEAELIEELVECEEEEALDIDDGFIHGVQDVPTEFHTEQYENIVENDFLAAALNRLSTFSIDVDTASYSNVRRFLNQGRLPPPNAVRIEELVNYFDYDYVQPEGDRPFSVHVEIATCPWNLEHRLAKIGLKGKEIQTETRPPANIVFLLDVSGSMESANKLPLVKQAMRMLIKELADKDTISIAVYAGASGLVLPATSCERKNRILAALDRLSAGGSTNGGAGIELAYQTATGNFIEGGINRVILCTDGDFNVGVTDDGSLVDLIAKKAKSGVFLSVLGFGMGNYKDSRMEKLADKGNGNYAYIDTELEAQKVLCDQLSGTLVTIAKDVKIQIELNPDKVCAYRLIGYENRLLKKEDFNDDTKDAGEIGAGHTVTALYELVPCGVAIDIPGVDPLRYQKVAQPAETRDGGSVRDEFFFLKLRYKEPDGEKSKLIETAVADGGAQYSDASPDFKFAAAVAAFGMILRDSKYKGTTSLDAVLELAGEGVGADEAGYRKAFVELAKKARRIKAQE